jgi:hypothetical protein
VCDDRKEERSTRLKRSAIIRHRGEI